jgi:site-specific DNA-methyltransferase (adenine-specific)
MMTKGMYSSTTSEWETPQDLFDKLNEEFGPFTLDPCATKENAKCKRFFTMEDNGLKQSWAERERESCIRQSSIWTQNRFMGGKVIHVC